jgi:hypothetical protein
MDGWVGVIMALVTMLGALTVGAFTRRSAKDANDTAQQANAGALYSTVTTTQTAELKRLADRLTLVEDDRDKAKMLAREHERWDRALRLPGPAPLGHLSDTIRPRHLAGPS